MISRENGANMVRPLQFQHNWQCVNALTSHAVNQRLQAKNRIASTFAMAKAVFTTKPDSGYDDIREERYHFPDRYLNRAKQTIGDQIIYYEPRRGDGRLAYFAVATVTAIEPDFQKPGHHYARMSDYLSFDFVVPFRSSDGFFEAALRGQNPAKPSGEFRNAIRLLPPEEFEAILAAGFQRPITSEIKHDAGVYEESMDYERPISEQLVRRPFRDQAFSRQVKGAYESRCAFTGLQMKNGGGRAEVGAAHIKPVGNNHRGSDSIRNGIALSKTIHWMFDRGLLSVDSKNKILTARNLVPTPIKNLLNPSGELILPTNVADRPHPAFLEYHRNRIFKESRT